MAHDDQSTAFAEVLQLLSDHGFDGMAGAIEILVNEAMKLERAEVLGANLAQYAKEKMPGRQDLKGRVGLTLDLQGYAPTINGLRGRGRMWLREGDVYELPLMVSILKILSRWH